MRLPRFSLRTTLILATLLPMLVGMLWRCGQLDGSMGDREIFNVRVFNVRVALYPDQFHVSTIHRWARFSRNSQNLPYLFPTSADDVRDWHPWDGREWQDYGSCSRLAVDWGPTFAGMTQGSVETHWASLRVNLQWLAKRLGWQ